MYEIKVGSSLHIKPTQMTKLLKHLETKKKKTVIFDLIFHFCDAFFSKLSVETFWKIVTFFNTFMSNI
jgi:hypothetical protein